MGATIATNKKAFRNYILTDKWECGIVLKGGEVKSVRAGRVNFKDTFARVDEGEMVLFNLHIEPYAQASYMNEEADRPRKLLMHKREIHKIEQEVAIKRLVLVPTKIYFNARGMLKVELALGQGKKQHDKRETIKTRKIDRDIARAVRQEQRR